MRRRSIVALSLVVLTYVGFGVWYGLAKPALHAPDENDHFLYAMLLRRDRVLPVMPGPEGGGIGQGHQPPLYYGVMAAVHAAFEPPLDRPGLHVPSGIDDAYRLLRLATLLLFGVPVVVLAFVLATRLAPDDTSLAFLAAALAALLPMFVHLSSSIANGMAADALSAGLLFATVAAMLRPRSPGVARHLLHGLLLGLAPLAKLTAVPVVAVCGVACVILAWRAERRGAALAALVLPPLLLIGSWCARNIALYGDPIGYAAFQAAFRSDVPDSVARGVTMDHLMPLWISFVGVFDNHGSVRPAMYPIWIYRAIGLLTGAAVLSGLVFRRRLARPGWPITGLFLAAMAATAAFFVASSQSLSHFQTRYVFVLLPVLAFYVARGALAPFTGGVRIVVAGGAATAAAVLVIWGVRLL